MGWNRLGHACTSAYDYGYFLKSCVTITGKDYNVLCTVLDRAEKLLCVTNVHRLTQGNHDSNIKVNWWNFGKNEKW